MKNRLVAVSLLITAALVLCGFSTAKPANEKVTLELLNPMGVIEPAKTIGLTPRIPDLAGKKVALLNNGKSGVRNLISALEELLKQKYPTATILTQYKAGSTADPREEEFQKIAKECDAFIFAIGD